jgi:sRNA-binding carbon storage regulator CsrA
LNNKRFNLIHSRKKRAEIIIGSNISAIIVEINNEKIAIIEIIARILKKV